MRYIAFILIFSLVYNINKFLEVGIDYETVEERTFDAEVNAWVARKGTEAQLRRNNGFTLHCIGLEKT